MANVFMGYFGYAFFESATSGLDEKFVRASNIDVKAMQPIEKPDLVDGRYDKTVYQLSPRVVEGNINFPIVYSQGSTDVLDAADLFDAALDRDSTSGDLTTDFDLTLSYGGTASGAIFKYTGCKLNQVTFSVQNEGVIELSCAVIGINREAGTPQTVMYPQRNARIATWNDARVAFVVGTGASGSVTTLEGNNIRSFNIVINNNVQRFYSLNGLLAPVAILATKRDITGTVVTLGRIDGIGNQAETNEDRCYEDSQVKFGYVPLSGCGTPFTYCFTGVVFEFEEIALTPDIFETTINYHVLPGAPQTTFPVPDSTCDIPTPPAT